MNKKLIFTLIATLYALEVSARAAAVKDAAKENNIAEGALFKALKEVGYNPKAEKGTEPPVFDEAADSSAQAGAGDGAADNSEAKARAEAEAAARTAQESDGKKITVTLRHKTEYSKYRRAGLVLSQKAEVHEVTESQLATLKSDKWVEVAEKEGGEK